MVRDWSSVTNMDNLEDVLDALNDFQKKLPKEFPPLLNDYLCHVAKTGETLFPWERLKPFFRAKIDDVMVKYNAELPSDHLVNSPNVENAKFEEMRARILVAFEKFSGAPFTVQRLCELIIEPKRHYKRTDKFLRGIEKNVLVVSTVDPFGRKIVSESPKNLVNGLDANGEEVVQTEESIPPPLENWSTDDVAATWPAQSTSNDTSTTVHAHNGEGDSVNHQSSDNTPSQSSDTSSFITSHPDGDNHSSDSSTSGEATPSTSQDNSQFQTTKTDSHPSDNNENGTSVDPVSSISEEQTNSIHQAPSSPVKSVEITASDIPVEISTSDIPVEISTSDVPVTESVIDTSDNRVNQNTSQTAATTNTLTEESVSTTANDSSPSKTLSDDLPEPETREVIDAAVTSSESAEKQTSQLSPSEDKNLDTSISQSDNQPVTGEINQDKSSLDNSTTDNVTSTDSTCDKIHPTPAESMDSETNEASSEQAVISDSRDKSVTDSPVVSQTEEPTESQASRCEEPMEQD